jgi:type IV secretion system protein VirB1
MFYGIPLRNQRFRVRFVPGAPCGEAPGPHRAPAAIAAAFAAAIAIAGPAWADPLSVGEFGQLALRCGASVAPSTLASIARTESAFQPLSINDNTTGTSGAPATRDIAIQIASKLLEAGHSVDVGIMQINSANFASLGLTLEAAFDPCKSVAAAAVILAGDYAGGDTHEGQQAALRVAISRYNTGDAQRGFANGYVHKVELAARHLVPAIDVGAAPAAIDSQPAAAAAPTAPVDPNAPPSWDVWPSYEYAAARHHDVQPPAAPTSAAGPAVSAAAEGGPAAAVPVSGPAVER